MLLKKNKVNIIVINSITKLLDLCLSQNYFEFNNQYYESKDGLIMSNPLSPILAEIFMDNLESIISQHHLFKYFTFWYKYVDDVVACFTGSQRQLTSFLNYINSIHENISLTLELELNNSINFLDLTIERKDNKFEFSIFHKPSHADLVIHNSSIHPFTQKMAAFHSFVHRLLSVPLSHENYLKELNLIKQIAFNNKYNPS